MQRDRALKTGKREVPGSIQSLACRDFFGVFYVFFRNSSKHELGFLKTTPPPTKDIPPIVRGPVCNKWTYLQTPTMIKI